MTENTGHLPFGGGWAEQPYWIAQAISILKTEHDISEKEEAEERMKPH